MKTNKPARNPAWLRSAVLATAACTPLAQAADPPPAIAGKNEWIFYRYESTTASDTAAADKSIDLIRRFNQVLARNGITMAFTMVPLKARLYAEHLPADFKLTPYMEANYTRMLEGLRAAQVETIDLNSAFVSSPKRNSDTPLYIRLDTHWSPTGALLAAETIRAGIDAVPTLKKALEAAPQEKFALKTDERKVASKARDLIAQLPPGSASYAPERVQDLAVTRPAPASGSLMGAGADPAITLLGSSYSSTWTRFPEALRYTLQRDVLAISVGADRGSWFGMESYLMDDAFQTNKPKLLIWEMPERDMRSPPDNQYREDRYRTDSTEWLLRASAWVQGSCAPSSVKVGIVAGGLAPAPAVPGQIKTGATADTDFIDLNFDKPIDRLDYLAANISTTGSKTIVLEASGADEKTRRFTISAAGDGASHVLRSPLPGAGKGYTAVRIFPGKNSAFELKNLQVCRQPEDLLK